MTRDEFIYKLLSLTTFDHCSSIWWRFRKGGSGAQDDTDVLDFYVDCSDLFGWGVSDVEPVTPETLGELEQALKDCNHDGEGFYLYCARRRKMRPQGAWFTRGYIDPKYMPLYAECGPEREVGHGNPHPFVSKDEYDATREGK